MSIPPGIIVLGGLAGGVFLTAFAITVVATTAAGLAFIAADAAARLIAHLLPLDREEDE